MMRWFHALMPKEERFFELFAAPLARGRGRCRGAPRHARRRRCDRNQLSDRDGPRAGRRQCHARGADRGAAHLHHPVRPRQHSRSDHVDGQLHRPDAEDRQVHPAVRRDRIHAADEGHGGHHRQMRRTGAGGRAAAQVDQPRSGPHQRSPSRFRRWRARPTRCTTRACTSSSGPTAGGTGSPSSSATRSTTTSRRSSTASTTSPT